MSERATTLSLVIPAYDECDGAEEIVDFYRRIQATHPDLHVELVVVDDGSTDGTAGAVAPGVGVVGTTGGPSGCR